MLPAFVAWCSSTVLSWGGGRPGELLRVASGLLSGGVLVLLLARLVLTG